MVHYRVYPISSVPRDEKSLLQWMYARYKEKDELLEKYYRTGSFLDQPVENGLKEGSSDILRLERTLSWNASWCWMIHAFYLISTCMLSYCTFRSFHVIICSLYSVIELFTFWKSIVAVVLCAEVCNCVISDSCQSTVCCCSILIYPRHHPYLMNHTLIDSLILISFLLSYCNITRVFCNGRGQNPLAISLYGVSEDIKRFQYSSIILNSTVDTLKCGAFIGYIQQWYIHQLTDFFTSWQHLSWQKMIQCVCLLWSCVYFLSYLTVFWKYVFTSLGRQASSLTGVNDNNNNFWWD